MTNLKELSFKVWYDPIPEWWRVDCEYAGIIYHTFHDTSPKIALNEMIQILKDSGVVYGEKI